MFAYIFVEEILPGVSDIYRWSGISPLLGAAIVLRGKFTSFSHLLVVLFHTVMLGVHFLLFTKENVLGNRAHKIVPQDFKTPILENMTKSSILKIQYSKSRRDEYLVKYSKMR